MKNLKNVKGFYVINSQEVFECFLKLHGWNQENFKKRSGLDFEKVKNWYFHLQEDPEEQILKEAKATKINPNGDLVALFHKNFSKEKVYDYYKMYIKEA